MNNFNNNRTIDLCNYLPGILKNVKELDAIMAVETPVINSIWQACEDCMNDQFISEATENGIARREKMLNITPFTSDTLEDRRFRVLTKYNENMPYTRRSLENLLAFLCGENGYQLTIITSVFTVNVKVALTAKKQVETIKELLERIIPYNMIFSVELLYNTWAKVKPYTWGNFVNTTWKELKEEVLS